MTRENVLRRVGPRVRSASCSVATALLVCVAILLLAASITAAVTHHAFAYDFRYSTWQAGRHVLDHTTPFVSPHEINMHGPGSATGNAPTWFVYPAPAALLFAPFALLPIAVGQVLFTVLCLACVWGALALLDVRKPSRYAIALAWPGVISGIEYANVSLLLLLALAVAWRWRDHPAAAGITIGLAIAFKLFVWPLGLWLAATRRYLHLGFAVASGSAISVAAWAIVGFDQIARYRDLLRALTRFEHGRTSSWTDVMLRAGAGDSVARAVPLTLALGACIGTLVLGRRGDDEGALAFAVVATLAATPILWSHYYALLLVPAILLSRAAAARRSERREPRLASAANPI